MLSQLSQKVKSDSHCRSQNARGDQSMPTFINFITDPWRGSRTKRWTSKTKLEIYNSLPFNFNVHQNLIYLNGVERSQRKELNCRSCGLMLMADYEFYRDVGEESVQKGYIISNISILAWFVKWPGSKAYIGHFVIIFFVQITDCSCNAIPCKRSQSDVKKAGFQQRLGKVKRIWFLVKLTKHQIFKDSWLSWSSHHRNQSLHFCWGELQRKGRFRKRAQVDKLLDMVRSKVTKIYVTILFKIHMFV